MSAIGLGTLVAAFLRRAWEPVPPSLMCSAEELSQIGELLLRSGGGALGWWRLRSSPLAAAPAARALRDAYRLHALQAAVHESNLMAALTVLQGAQVEALLAKGWALDRRYPQPGLRPYGDLDLFVWPTDHARAAEALSAGGLREAVDLHSGCARLRDRPFAAIWDRSRFVPLRDRQVRVLGPEDELHFLCMHLLEHGAQRPIWLCDIGLLLSRMERDFQWGLCLGRDPRRARWVDAALWLAQDLLGASPTAGPAPVAVPWLSREVRRAWGRGHKLRHPMGSLLLRPLAAAREAPRHWPNPIESVAALGAPTYPGPLLPLQLAELLRRAARLRIRP